MNKCHSRGYTGHKMMGEFGLINMPDERNYSFRLDTGMKLDDFKREFQLQRISEREFYDSWNSVYYDRKEGKFKKWKVMIS